MALIPIEDLTRRPQPAGWAPFALGFRPFFLAAGIYAVALMGIWVGALRGNIGLGDLSPLVWHGHEMVFGFAVAVIAGFLLTAVQNWTGIRTPSGAALAALFLLWLAGRLAFFVPGLPHPVVAAIDLAFLPALGLVLARPILRAKQLHNYPFPLMLLAMTAANAMLHADVLGWLDDGARTGLHFAVYVVILMIVVMGGRVIPSFTDNKLRTRARRWPWVERPLPWVTLAALAAALLAPDSNLTAALAGIAALLHGVRLAGWHTPKYWGEPLLWVLHLGYAWIVAGFVLLALSAAGLAGATGSALHAFTAGAIGVLTLGMMARVALGHTGRKLEVLPLMILAFVEINFAALVRVAVPLLHPDAYVATMTASGLFWIVGFGLFAVIYAPVLLRTRVDGRPG